jgi:hypothetical protein
MSERKNLREKNSKKSEDILSCCLSTLPSTVEDKIEEPEEEPEVVPKKNGSIWSSIYTASRIVMKSVLLSQLLVPLCLLYFPTLSVDFMLLVDFYTPWTAFESPFYAAYHKVRITTPNVLNLPWQ